MRRVTAFHHHTSRHWLDLSISRQHTGIDAELQGGMDSYAYKQAAMFQRMADVNQMRWKEISKTAKSMLLVTDLVDGTDVVMPTLPSEEGDDDGEQDEVLGVVMDQTIDAWEFGEEDSF